MNAIKTFEIYCNIIKIKSNIRTTQKFSFAFLNADDIKKKIGKLDESKASQIRDQNNLPFVDEAECKIVFSCQILLV